jgi:hypothetical protein
VQSAQAPPSTPQALVRLPVRQTPFWQQPRQLAQAPASIIPPMVPASAATHAPAVQVSLRVQAAHAAPFAPQAAVLVAVTHCPIASQQPMQLMALHVEVGPQLANDVRSAETTKAETPTRRGDMGAPFSPLSAS